VDWLIRLAPMPLNPSVAEGTNHVGLTATGTITVSGIRGLRVLLTTIPTWFGSSPGTPTLRYGVGRIDMSTAEGWSTRRWIHDTPLEIIPVDPLVTTVAYSLSAGVVATIVELVQGP